MNQSKRHSEVLKKFLRIMCAPKHTAPLAMQWKKKAFHSISEKYSCVAIISVHTAIIQNIPASMLMVL